MFPRIKPEKADDELKWGGKIGGEERGIAVTLLIVVYIPSPFRRHLIPARRRRLTLKFIRPFITRA
jgi:hypothetical protein